MKRQTKHPLYLTRHDYGILDGIVARYPELRETEFLEQELARAQIVPEHELPDNVVSLYSRARFRDESKSEPEALRELTVVTPETRGSEPGMVSVLAPVGAALIGLSEGHAVEWRTPSGQKRRLRVVKVLYQPEASERAAHGRRLDCVDQASIESFPASDAPGWRL